MAARVSSRIIDKKLVWYVWGEFGGQRWEKQYSPAVKSRGTLLGILSSELGCPTNCSKEEVVTTLLDKTWTGQEWVDDFSIRLRELREKAGLTQASLAERAGLSHQAIAALEQGTRGPTWDTVRRLARTLNVSFEAFKIWLSSEDPKKGRGDTLGRGHSRWHDQFERLRRWHARLADNDAGTLKVVVSTECMADDAVAFFQACYHVKDYLKHDPAFMAATIPEIEDFVHSTPCLALCGDLCNGTKHCSLTRSKTGDVPKLGRRVIHAHAGGGPISQKMEIEHDGKKYDVFDLATQCVRAWEHFLAEHTVT